MVSKPKRIPNFTYTSLFQQLLKRGSHCAFKYTPRLILVRWEKYVRKLVDSHRAEAYCRYQPWS